MMIRDIAGEFLFELSLCDRLIRGYSRDWRMNPRITRIGAKQLLRVGLCKHLSIASKLLSLTPVDRTKQETL